MKPLKELDLKVVDKMLDWENAGKIDLLKVGYSLRAPELLFRKIVYKWTH